MSTDNKKAFCIRTWDVVNSHVDVGGNLVPIADFVRKLKEYDTIMVGKAPITLQNLKTKTVPEFTHVYTTEFIRVATDSVSLFVSGGQPLPPGEILCVSVLGRIQPDKKSGEMMVENLQHLYFYRSLAEWVRNTKTIAEQRVALASELNRMKELMEDLSIPYPIEPDKGLLFTPFISTSEQADADITFLNTTKACAELQVSASNIIRLGRGCLITDDRRIIPASIGALSKAGYYVSYVTHHHNNPAIIVLYIHTDYGRIMIYGDEAAFKLAYNVPFGNVRPKTAERDFSFLARLLRWLGK